VRIAVLALLGIALVLAGLFVYCPPVFGIPCLGWYKDLLLLVKGTSGAVLILFGLVALASAK
jgi:hypothetical protein